VGASLPKSPSMSWHPRSLPLDPCKPSIFQTETVVIACLQCLLFVFAPWYLILQQSDIDPRSEEDLIANPTFKRRSSAAGSRYLELGRGLCTQIGWTMPASDSTDHTLQMTPMSVKQLAVRRSSATVSNRISPEGSGLFATASHI
jgi:hypothetical protein